MREKWCKYTVLFRYCDSLRLFIMSLDALYCNRAIVGMLIVNYTYYHDYTVDVNKSMNMRVLLLNNISYLNMRYTFVIYNAELNL